MLRLATPADREALIALALAEDAAWSDAPPVSAEEVGEFIGSCEPGVIFERDGRVAGYAAAGEGDRSILLVDPGDDPEPALEALVAWLGERGHHEVTGYGRDARRIAWLESNEFTHRRSFFDLPRGIDAPLAPAVWPGGVAVARYRPGEDDEAVHALIYVDAAWAEVPGHTQRSLEAGGRRSRPSTAAGSRAATGAPSAGSPAACSATGAAGSSSSPSPAPPRPRPRPRAPAALRSPSFREHGAASLALGVQGENENAVGLYRDVGFEVEREWRAYSRPDPAAPIGRRTRLKRCEEKIRYRTAAGCHSVVAVWGSGVDRYLGGRRHRRERRAYACSSLRRVAPHVAAQAPAVERHTARAVAEPVGSVELLQPLDRGADVSEVSLQRGLDRRLGHVLR